MEEHVNHQRVSANADLDMEMKTAPEVSSINFFCNDRILKVQIQTKANQSKIICYKKAQIYFTISSLLAKFLEIIHLL